jgi:hypothetical protein
MRSFAAITTATARPPGDVHPDHLNAAPDAGTVPHRRAGQRPRRGGVVRRPVVGGVERGKHTFAHVGLEPTELADVDQPRRDALLLLQASLGVGPREVGLRLDQV